MWSCRSRIRSAPPSDSTRSTSTAQDSEGRPAPPVLGRGAHDRSATASAPRRQRPGPGLDPRGAHPLPRASSKRRYGLQRHGVWWVTIREAVAAGTLRPSDKGLAEVVSRFEQLLQFIALRLRPRTRRGCAGHVDVREAADPALRFEAQAKSLVSAGMMSGALRIPDAAGLLSVSADVRASRVTVWADVDAPREGRAATRVNWILRQLRDAPDGLRVDAFAQGSRTSSSALLKAVRDDPALLIPDPKANCERFEWPLPRRSARNGEPGEEPSSTAWSPRSMAFMPLCSKNSGRGVPERRNFPSQERPREGGGD